VDKDVIEKYITYIRPLCKRNVPVIFDWEHLGRLLGRTDRFIATAVASPDHFYRTFKIPKRSGGQREIKAPYKSLLECQRWIHNEILCKLATHSAAIGYIRGKSILNYVTPHSNFEKIYITDLENFFPSITFARVINLFLNIGYSNQVSFALAKLCCLGDSLPQGAATSPAISNIICKSLDSRLYHYSNKNSIIYTRYVDDLCFSGNNIDTKFRQIVSKIIKSEGFTINFKKTRIYQDTSNLKIITGINIASGQPKLPKSYTRDLKLALYHIEKHGFRSHVAKMKIHKSTYLQHLLGKINYWLFVEPNNAIAIKYKKILMQLLPSN
jgi:hypothetical protein